MFDALVNITEFLWGTPLMILMVGVGLYLSARTGFFQITGFGTVCKKTLGEVFKKDNESEKGEGQLKPSEAATLQAWQRPLPLAAQEPCSGCW